MFFRIIFHRMVWALPLLLGVSLIAFVLMHLSPGNYFDRMRLNPQISEQTIKDYETRYHLDEPLLVQYFWWLANLLRGDLGYSFYYHSPVVDVISSRIKNTLLLSLVSMAVIWIAVIPMGIWAVRIRQLDPLLSVVAFVFMCLPSFFLAFLFLFFALLSGILPLGGMHSLFYDSLPLPLKLVDIARHLVIPALVISLPSIGSLFRIVRANLLEKMRAPFVLNAYSKGIPERYVFSRYVLPNAMHPLVVIFGYQLSDILSGAALTEIICNWPGLGTIMLSAVQSQDVFLVLAGLMLSGIMLLLGNLVSDLALYYLDPRTRQ